ncbi:MAG TPA: hypothetical protein VHM31_23600, partial [Polyangia bacterium]|nr:hypothetical protein [Polyangia bacterium]
MSLFRRHLGKVSVLGLAMLAASCAGDPSEGGTGGAGPSRGGSTGTGSGGSATGGTTSTPTGGSATGGHVATGGISGSGSGGTGTGGSS